MRVSLAKKCPELLIEWDYDRNVEDPSVIPWNSSKRIWWVCSKDKRHKWDTQLGCRTKLGAGCPFCSGLRVLIEDSFGSKFPHLLEEWNSKNNMDPLSVRAGSDRRVWWICKFGHEWKTAIKHRTLSGSNCPYCAGKKIGYGNSFAENCQELLKEWSYLRNTINPFSIGPASHKDVWWECEFGHTWKARIKDRNLRGRGCPRCSKRISKPSVEWLDNLGIILREYYININGKKFFVDGYDPKTNTIYEYHGYFWHGHPEYFNPQEKHPYCEDTFGRLYEKTLEKEKTLKAAGYNLVVKWGV